MLQRAPRAHSQRQARRIARDDRDVCERNGARLLDHIGVFLLRQSRTRRFPSAPGSVDWSRPSDLRDDDQADFLFFLSSSTSVNSASTTSSLAAPLAAALSPPC